MGDNGDWDPPEGGTPIDNQPDPTPPAPPAELDEPRQQPAPRPPARRGPLRAIQPGDEQTLYVTDRQAEAALLGCLLRGADPAIVDNAAWTIPGAANIHHAIRKLVDDGAPLEPRLIAATAPSALDQLVATSTDGIDVTGATALVTLIATAPPASSAPHYAAIVTDLHHRRLVAATLATAIEQLRDGDIDQALTTAARARDVAPTTTKPALRVHWVTDTLEDPPPTKPDLVRGVLARGEVTGLGANRAVGKSWLGMNLATLLSRGAGWFLGDLQVLDTARTLYCHGEMDHTNAARRWEHLNGAYQPPDGIAETFDRWRLRVVEHRATTTHAGGTDSDKWYQVILDDRLEQTIHDHSIDVLMIDPWAVYYAGAENSNDEVEAAIDELRRIAVDHDIAVILFHHLRKSAGDDINDPEDAWRGASRLPDSVNNRITLLPHYTLKQATEQGMTRKQARRYQDVYFLRRGAEAPDDISIRWDPATGWWERWKTGAEAGGGRPANQHYNPVDVAHACHEAGGSWDSINEAAKHLGISPTTAGKKLEAAVAAGHLEHFNGPKGARGYRVPDPPDDLSERSDGMF